MKFRGSDGRGKENESHYIVSGTNDYKSSINNQESGKFIDKETHDNLSKQDETKEDISKTDISKTDISKEGIEKPTKRPKSLSRNILMILVLILAAVATALAMSRIVVWIATPRAPFNLMVKESTNSETVANLNESNTFDYNLKYIGVQMGDTVAELSLDLTNAELTQCDLMNDSAVIVYLREDGKIQDEIYIGSDISDGLGTFTSEDLVTVMNSKDTLLSKSKSGELNGVEIQESIYSLYKIGYVYIRESQLLDKAEDEESFINSPEVIEIDSESFVKSLRDSIVFSKGDANNNYINLREFGRLNVNNLTEVTGNSGILYKKSDGMICINNPAERKVKVFISYMGNQLLGNVGEKLIPTEYNNVYVDYGWRNSADWGYRSFGIMTTEGMYYFKVGESVRYPDQFAQEIIDWLGIKKDDEKLETPYNMELTLDDLRPTLGDENRALLEKNKKTED